MGLQIWLPLNGNVNNQGLASNLTFQSLNATVNTSGKIGSCYYFNGTNASIDAVHDKSMWRGKPVSYALWFKSDGNKASGTILEIGADLCLIYTYADNLVKFGYWRSYKNTSGSRGGDRLYSQKTYDSSKWHHIAITFNGGIIKLYVDGTLDTSWDRTSLYTDNDPFLLASNYNRIALGRSYGSTSFIGGLANDLRIYDHCLSAEEVKWISQGLTLHYPLSNRGFGGDNIIKNSWPEERTYTYPSSSYSDKFSPITTIVPSASKYTLSFYAKSTVNGDKIRTHYYSPNTTTTCVSSQGITKTASDGNMDFTLSTSWKRYWVTYTQNETTAVKHVICPRLLSGQGTGTVSIKGIKLEEGEKATAWIPNSADTLYSSLQLGSTAELDCSGYQYNGIKNNVVNDTDSPVNQGCYVFNGTDSWVRCDTNAWMVQGATEFTVNWWAYASDWTAVTNGGRMVSCTESGGFNTEGGATGYLRFPHYVYTNEAKTSRAYQYNNNGIKLADLTPGWHMFTLIYNLAGEKIYIDGTLHSSANSTSYGISFNTNARLYLGCEANSASPYTPFFNGKMSDFRFYYTELNEDAIKELYMLGNKL